MNEDERVQDIHRKIEREKALMNAANAMRSQTNNEAVRSRLDSQMRDGRRNIQFFEEKLRELQMRRGMEHMSMGPDSPGLGGDAMGYDHGPAPPPKDTSDRAGYGPHEYSQIGGHGDLMPPRQPFDPNAPGSSPNLSKPRPNFTKLGMRDVVGAFALSVRSIRCANPEDLSRPYQIRLALSRTPDPAYAVPDSVQAECGGAVPKGC